MKWYIEPPIPFKPYPIAAGAYFGYRLFDGEKWHDCDKDGNVKGRK